MGTKRKGPSLRTYAKTLKQLPQTVAIEVAERGAGKITTAARDSFDDGRTANDETRPLGENGNVVSLYRSGKLRAVAIRFLHDGGTKIRTAITEKYMGVHIGRFLYLPIGQGGRLPARWRQLLGLTADGVLTEEARP
jgi:hypothetical protein